MFESTLLRLSDLPARGIPSRVFPFSSSTVCDVSRILFVLAVLIVKISPLLSRVPRDFHEGDSL